MEHALPEFCRHSQKGGFEAANQAFTQVAQVEKYHEARYQALIKNVEQGKVFKKDAKVKWQCRNCGFVHEGTEAPEKCAACQHPRAYFEIMAENY